MKKTLLIILTLLGTNYLAQAQFNQHYQYFDGADTSPANSIIIIPDTSSTNIWQVGPPQKIIFDTPATAPNVLVTDTINTYPVNNVSSFEFGVHYPINWGILAVRWKQKLDMDSAQDGGKIEYSVDSGQTWNNVFNNPYVYNFYGFNQGNVDSLPTGDSVFTGTDTVWRDIWLCFDNSFLFTFDSVCFRFTFSSDAIDNNKEGWMIDNMMVHPTIVHTVKKTENSQYLQVYPTNTTGRVYIEAEKLQEFHIIESIQLINMSGQVVQVFGKSPTKFYIDISNHPNGMYYLKVNTNIKSETFPVVLTK